jgi:hypothetical protein
MSGDHNMNQKPVAWFHEEKYKTHFTTDPSEDMIGKYWQPLYTAPLTVSMQEPVGEVLNERGEVDYISYIPPVGTPLYTAPRQWVGLTDEEYQIIHSKNYNYEELALAVEAKLNEKNG